MATPIDKQIAKEIIIAYIARGDTGGFFTETNPPLPTFETVWNRILKAISGEPAK